MSKVLNISVNILAVVLLLYNGYQLRDKLYYQLKTESKINGTSLNDNIAEVN